MKIVITGATGFIGRALCNKLAKEHNVIALTRRLEKASIIFQTPVDIIKWNPEVMDGWEKYLEGSDTVLNLAGANLAAGRWTKDLKAEIVNSRINSSGILLQAIKKTQAKPKTFIIASAIGFYGSRGDEQLYEETENGQGFLAEVCRKNESIVKEFEDLDVRTIVIRTGVVLDTSGGALPKMAMPFRFYIGGYWGSGRQWISWISLADEISAIKFLIENYRLKGVFNLTSPEPERNHHFFQILGDRLKKPCWLPMPAFFLKIMFGQMADELFLTSQRVYPKKLLAAGFKFRNPNLKNALQSMKFRRIRL
ncbi:MAG: TIGR01777 family oxidoreductase [Planctomycetota bacterium]|nr:MAG: TIGR01777 family oxidoreductase [Planctomycetota bacterium]